MSFVLLVVFAFLTKPILESSMVKGKLGFFKTYFIFGGLLTLAVAFLIMFVTINSVADMGGGGASFKLVGVTKAILTVASLYYLMLALALYNISKMTRSYSVKLACYFFISVLILAAATGLFFSLINTIVYMVLVFLIYKYIWKQDIHQALTSTVIRR